METISVGAITLYARGARGADSHLPFWQLEPSDYTERLMTSRGLGLYGHVEPVDLQVDVVVLALLARFLLRRYRRDQMVEEESDVELETGAGQVSRPNRSHDVVEPGEAL